MPELSSSFAAALTAIEPDEDVTHAMTARDEVVAVLLADPTLNGWGVDPILIGSYKRHVSIKRIKDVDVFCRLDSVPSEIEPIDLLEAFREILEASFPGRVILQGRSVQVEFPNYDMFIDAVPARPWGDVWELPCKDPDQGWELTNPVKFGELVTSLNTRLDGRYVPAVKLMRQTRRSLIGDARPRGLTAEVLTYWALEAEDDTSSMAECFVLALEGAADQLEAHIGGSPITDPAMDDQELRMGATAAELDDFSAKVRQAAIDARAAFDDDDECAGARVFRRLLGKGPDGDYVFPLPEGCSTYGTERSSFAIRPGAQQLPSQETPRFA